MIIMTNISTKIFIQKIKPAERQVEFITNILPQLYLYFSNNNKLLKMISGEQNKKLLIQLLENYAINNKIPIINIQQIIKKSTTLKEILTALEKTIPKTNINAELAQLTAEQAAAEQAAAAGVGSLSSAQGPGLQGPGLQGPPLNLPQQGLLSQPAGVPPPTAEDLSLQPPRRTTAAVPTAVPAVGLPVPPPQQTTASVASYRKLPQVPEQSRGPTQNAVKVFTEALATYISPDEQQNIITQIDTKFKELYSKNKVGGVSDYDFIKTRAPKLLRLSNADKKLYSDAINAAPKEVTKAELDTIKNKSIQTIIKKHIDDTTEFFRKLSETNTFETRRRIMENYLGGKRTRTRRRNRK